MKFHPIDIWKYCEIIHMNSIPYMAYSCLHKGWHFLKKINKSQIFTNPKPIPNPTTHAIPKDLSQCQTGSYQASWLCTITSWRYPRLPQNLLSYLLLHSVVMVNHWQHCEAQLWHPRTTKAPALWWHWIPQATYQPPFRLVPLWVAIPSGNKPLHLCSLHHHPLGAGVSTCINKETQEDCTQMKWESLGWLYLAHGSIPTWTTWLSWQSFKGWTDFSQTLWKISERFSHCEKGSVCS